MNPDLKTTSVTKLHLIHVGLGLIQCHVNCTIIGAKFYDIGKYTGDNSFYPNSTPLLHRSMLVQNPLPVGDLGQIGDFKLGSCGLPIIQSLSLHTSECPECRANHSLVSKYPTWNSR